MENAAENLNNETKQVEDTKPTNKELMKTAKKLRHPAEHAMTIVSILFTLFIFAGLAFGPMYVLINKAAMHFFTKHTGLSTKVLSIIFGFGGGVGIILVLVVIVRITYENLTFLGQLKAKEMRASDTVYEDICSYYRERGMELGMEELPPIFLTKSSYQSKFLGVDVRGKNAITLNLADVVNAEKTDDWLNVKYTICRRLARIFLGHYGLGFQVATFMGRLLPFYRQTFSRTMTYSVDRLVQKMMGDEDVLHAILDSCCDISKYKETDISKIAESIIKDYSKAESVSKFGANMMADVPILPYRLEALMDKSRPGRVL